MQDDRLPHLRKHSGIDFRVIVSMARNSGQCAARHQDDAPTHRFNGLALFEVSIGHILQGERFARRQMVGASAARDYSPSRFSGGRAAFDKLQAPAANPIPFRVARCPLLRPRQSQATTDARGRRVLRPSRSPDVVSGSAVRTGSTTTCAAAKAMRVSNPVRRPWRERLACRRVIVGGPIGLH